MSVRATTNPSERALRFQPVMTMRPRTASMRYETGLIVAIARNQSHLHEVPGAFIDDMNRKMKVTERWIRFARPGCAAP